MDVKLKQLTSLKRFITENNLPFGIVINNSIVDDNTSQGNDTRRGMKPKQEPVVNKPMITTIMARGK